MIKSKHNQYVSTPDWFSNKPQETIQTAQPSQSVIVSSSSDTIVQQEPLALHQLTDVASDDNGVIGAVEGAVLKFDGTNWYGDKIPGEGIECLLKEVFSKIFTAYDIDGNVVDITDVNSIINDISINYSLWSKGYLSALGRQSDTSSGSMGALYQLVDVLADGDKVQGAEEGSILKYDGTHWYAGTDEGFNIGLLEDYLVSQKYLTESQADELFLTEEEGDARYLLKTVFTKLFTAYDASGKTVDITDFNTVIDNVSINYNLWSPGYISAQGRQDGGTSGSAAALYQLADVLSDGNKVQGAEEGSVLKYDGTHWYADKISFDGENYATIDWVLSKDYATNASLRQLSDIVDTKWTQDDEKIKNLDETYQKLNDWFYKDEDGHLHSRYGFVGDEFISTLGVSDNPINLPSGGITEVYWDDVIDRPTNLSQFTDDVVAGKYLPLSGGTLSNNTIGLIINRTTANTPWLSFQKQDVNVGRLGMETTGPVYYDITTNSSKTIYHTGNFNPANYLPLSGGTISGTDQIPLKITTSYNPTGGNFPVGLVLTNTNKNNTNSRNYGTAQFGYSKTSGAYIFNYNDYANVNCAIGITDDGIAYVGKGGSISEKYEILHKGNYSSYALPLFGGTLSNNGSDFFIINRKDGWPFIKMSQNGTALGYIGMNNNKQPVYLPYDGSTFMNFVGSDTITQIKAVSSLPASPDSSTIYIMV